MIYEAVREVRMQEFVSLQVMRTRYEQAIADAKHAEAAVIKGQISRQCGKLDGIDLALEALSNG